MHVGLIGGLGTGKTTLAKAIIQRFPKVAYVYMSRYAVRIPMALHKTTHPQLLTYPRDKYIDTILANTQAPEQACSRAEMDAFGKEVFSKYGSTIAGEIVLRTANKTTVFDGLATIANVTYMKEHGVHVVGLYCPFETQVARRLKDARDIDPKKRSELERQIRSTEEFYEIGKIMELADTLYDTNKLNSAQIAEDLMPVLQK